MRPQTTLALMAAFFITLGSLAFAADHGTITGTVRDAATGTPLSGATVVVKGAGLSALTGADGRFTIANVPAGFHTVEASIAGYRTSTVRLLRVSKNAAATVNFKLRAEKPRNKDAKMDVLKCQYAPMSMACGIVSAECDRSACYLPPDFNTEEYSRIYENKFLEVIHDPLSTFSIDVDPASYANVRRFLSGGQMPPKDAVRIEELVNYFTYDYPQPESGDPFAIDVEMAGCPWNPAHKLVRIGLKGREVPTEKLPPANLVFLIDVSGSMQSPDKLPLLKAAFKMLVNDLRP